MTKYVDADWVWMHLPDDLPYKGAVKRVLIQAPAADVPVVRSRWVFDCERIKGDGFYYKQYHCSRCAVQTVCTTAFCPHCGADMREEDG